MRTQSRTIQIRGGDASGHAGWVHVGLGSAERAEIRVQWPDGEWSPSYRVFANQFVVVDRLKPQASNWYPNLLSRGRRALGRRRFLPITAAIAPQPVGEGHGQGVDPILERLLDQRLIGRIREIGRGRMHAHLLPVQRRDAPDPVGVGRASVAR